jgi:hypothetical protein
VYALAVNIAMDGLNEVGVGVASLPNGEGNEAALPADAGERELAAFLVANPIYERRIGSMKCQGSKRR